MRIRNADVLQLHNMYQPMARKLIEGFDVFSGHYSSKSTYRGLTDNDVIRSHAVSIEEYSLALADAHCSRSQVPKYAAALFCTRCFGYSVF